MTLVQFFRLFNRKFNIFLLSTLVLVVAVFVFTRSLSKTYETETEIYTGIASGLNVNSVEKATLDYFATSNAYDNLINVIRSRQTLELTGERLLAQHLMLDTSKQRYISEEAWGNLQYMVPKKLKDSLVVKGDTLKTLENIQQYKIENYSSKRIKLLFFDGASPYSQEAIQGVQVERIGNSDLIKLKYSWSDPGIAQNTLVILNQVFTGRLSAIKQGQGADVVEYFRKQVTLSEAKLGEREEILKEFRTRNRVINYNEQTKSIAMEKEKMEDEYQKELAMKAAKEASVEKLEEQLALNREILRYAQEALEKKSELNTITARIAELEVFLNDKELLDKLKYRQKQLRKQVQSDLLSKYAYSKTTDGVKMDKILEEWLNSTLALKESNARLEVFQTRKQYFNRKYDEFAPLGSELDKMEREIDVQERNYLELLNSYNNALMRQESESLSTGGLVITVPPYFPLEPLKSKRLLLILVAGLVGFIVPLAFVVLMEFLDNSIRTPQRAEEFTNQKLLGAYPNLSQKGENKTIDMDWLKNHSVGLMSQNLRLQTRRQNILDKKPKLVLVYSTRGQEGKSLMTHVLANELVSLNFRVLVIGSNSMEEEDRFYDFNPYEFNKSFLKVKSFTELVEDQYDEGLYDFIFFIINSVTSEQYPIELVEKADMAVHVINVNRTWKKGDTFALNEFTKTLKTESRLLANGVEPDDMDVVLGEIAKKRTFLRRLAKNVIDLEFKSKNMKRDY